MLSIGDGPIDFRRYHAPAKRIWARPPACGAPRTALPDIYRRAEWVVSASAKRETFGNVPYEVHQLLRRPHHAPKIRQGGNRRGSAPAAHSIFVAIDRPDDDVRRAVIAAGRPAAPPEVASTTPVPPRVSVAATVEALDGTSPTARVVDRLRAAVVSILVVLLVGVPWALFKTCRRARAASLIWNTPSGFTQRGQL